MNNKLEVPKSFVVEFKTVFNNKKRAMSARWLMYSFIFGFSLALIIMGVIWYLLGAIDIHIIEFTVYIGVVSSFLKGRPTLIYRKKIIADIESAEPMVCDYDFDYDSVDGGLAHANLIPTMAGTVKFISIQSPEMGLSKKHGKLFDYYVYNVDHLDKKDLRKFIAVPDNC